MSPLRAMAERVRKEASYTAFGAAIVEFVDHAAALIDGLWADLELARSQVAALEAAEQNRATAAVHAADAARIDAES